MDLPQLPASQGPSISPTQANGFPMHDDKWFQDRRKDIVVLMMRFLVDHGYTKAYESLCQEAQLNLSQMDTADNIDLMTIVQEYIHYFRHKFGKPPVLTRQLHPMLAEARGDLRDMGPRQDVPHRGTLRAHDPHGGLGPGLLTPDSSRLGGDDRRMLLHPSEHTRHHASSPAHMGIADDMHKPGLIPAVPYQPDMVVPSTFLLGSVEPCTQDQLLRQVNEAQPTDLSTVFSFYRPKRTRPAAPKRASAQLDLSEFQEDLLYCLVGCDGVGWSIRNVHSPTRAWLHSNHGIDKELLQLFYKNRAPKKRKEDA